jgi:hypothetical protein
MAPNSDAKSLITQAQSGSYSTTQDCLHHSVWDTRWFGPTPSDNTFFTQPIGASWAVPNCAVGSKTKNETNLGDTGKLPQGQNFLVQRVGVALISSYDVLNTGASSGWADPVLIAQAFYNILQASVFDIVIAGKAFDAEIHGRQFLPCLALNGHTTSNSGRSNSTRNGDSLASGWVKLDPTPVTLSNLVSFSVTMSSQVGNATVAAAAITNSYAYLSTSLCTMMVTLEGFLTRMK